MGNPNLSVENLFNMSDEKVKTDLQSVFKQQLKASEPVKGMFFPSASMPVEPQNTTFVSNVALSLVGSAVGLCNAYSFNETVNATVSKNYWEGKLTSEEGAKESRYLYGALFGNSCAINSVTFNEYLNNNPTEWGTKLANYLVTDKHINQEVNKLIAGEKNWNERLNTLLYKLHRLNQNECDNVTRVFQEKIAGFALQWQSMNYFNAGMLQQDMYSSEINKAAVVEDSHYIPNYSPYGGGGVSNFDKEYGAKLWSFIKNNLSKIGVTTGTKPENQGFETCTAYGCHTSMSRALKSDAIAVPLAETKSGDTLVDGNGNARVLSDDTSSFITHVPLWIYGINEGEPFFTGETVFQTPKGEWKSILPDVANQINPNLQAKKLEEGDEILHVVSTNPLSHQTVKIEKITQKLLPSGAMIARPLFYEVPTYHVEGFLVALNAPMITPNRLKEALQRLEAPEQKALYKGLHDLMPLLTKAMGNYIEAPLMAAFKNVNKN